MNNHEIGRDLQKVNLMYRVSSHKRTTRGSLMDRGANDGLAGDDVRILERTGFKVDV